MGALVIGGAFAAVFLCAPFLLIAANRSGWLARWDERERKRLARSWDVAPPPRWLQWVSLVLLVSYLPAEAFIWQRRHDLALVLAQVPSILWLAAWTVGWGWRVKLLQRWTRHRAGSIEKE